MKVPKFDRLTESGMINNAKLNRYKAKRDKQRKEADRIKGSSHSAKYEKLRKTDPIHHIKRYKKIISRIPLLSGIAVGFSAVYNERQTLNMIKEYVADLDTLQEPYASFFGKDYMGQFEYITFHSDIMYNHYYKFAEKYPGGRIQYLCEYYLSTGIWLDLFRPDAYGLGAIADIDPFRLPKWIKALDLHEFYQRCIQSGFIIREARERETRRNGYSIKSMVMAFCDRFFYAS